MQWPVSWMRLTRVGEGVGEPRGPLLGPWREGRWKEGALVSARDQVNELF
jgi:hypothetical protein